MNEIKKALKEKHRQSDDPPEGTMIGELPLEAANARHMPDPASEKIEPEKEMVLHSVICRAGYQRNIHRTEGVAYKSLYQDLLDFFLLEMQQAGLQVPGVQETKDEDTAQPEEVGGFQGAPEQPAETGGEVRDQKRSGTRPKLGVATTRKRTRRKRKKA